MDATQQIQTQFEIECIGLNQSGLLVRILSSFPDNIARGFAFQHIDDYSLYFHRNLHPSIREKIT